MLDHKVINQCKVEQSIKSRSYLVIENSSDMTAMIHTSLLFMNIFPDSKICEAVTMGRQKASAEHVTSNFLKAVASFWCLYC